MSDQIDTRFCPERNEGAAWVVLDGEVVILDGATGGLHLLNPTAALAWQCFDGHGSVEEIAADLAEVFGAPADAVLADVLELTRELGRQGLLDGFEATVTSGVHAGDDAVLPTACDDGDRGGRGDGTG